jgi:nucleotide-binding universal stress UspA family protein
MKGYQKILIGTDFSDASVTAARRGVELARHYDASLILLHVIEHFPEDMPSEWVAPEDRDPATFYRERAHNALAELAEKIGQKNAGQKVIASTSSARHEILRFAKSERIDLIVVGWHGAGALPVFGSTAMGVASDAPCDVMVVRTAD